MYLQNSIFFLYNGGDNVELYSFYFFSTVKKVLSLFFFKYFLRLF